MFSFIFYVNSNSNTNFKKINLNLFLFLYNFELTELYIQRNNFNLNFWKNGNNLKCTIRDNRR